MLETLAIILVVLWLLGLVTSTTLGGLIHVLLVVAIVVILIRVIFSRSRFIARDATRRHHASSRVRRTPPT